MAAPVVTLDTEERNLLWDAIDFAYTAHRETLLDQFGKADPTEREIAGSDVADYIAVMNDLGWQREVEGSGEFHISVPSRQFTRALNVADEHVREILADESPTLVRLVDRGDPDEWMSTEDGYLRQGFAIRMVRERMRTA